MSNKDDIKIHKYVVSAVVFTDTQASKEYLWIGEAQLGDAILIGRESLAKQHKITNSSRLNPTMYLAYTVEHEEDLTAAFKSLANPIINQNNQESS